MGMVDGDRRVKNRTKWLIVAGSFGVQCGTSAMAKCFGSLVIDWKERFQCTAWEITAVQGIMVALWLGLAPISNALCIRFSTRKVVFVGGVFASIGFTIASFAPSVSWFIVSQGVIVGIGYGLAYSPSTVIVAQTFKTKRGIAMGIAQCGIGFGSLLMPVVNRQFVQAYGIQGSTLIQGAIVSNICVCAMLFKTVDKYHDQSIILINSDKVNSFTETEHNIQPQSNAKLTDVQDNVTNQIKLQQRPYSGLDPENQHVLVPEVKCGTDNEKKSSSKSSKQYFNWNLFCDPLFIIYFISTVFFSGCGETGYILFSSEAIEQGFSKETANFLTTITGTADFFIRILIGPIADCCNKIIPRRYLFSFLVISMGLNSILSPFTTTYSGLAVCSAIHGVTMGSCSVLSVIVFADIIGVKNCPSAYGITYLSEAAIILFCSNAIGMLRDETGHWHTSFWFAGSLSVVGGLISFLDPCIRHRLRTP